MTTDDPRLVPANARVAHVALRGRIAAARHVLPQAYRCAVPVAPLLTRPGGELSCQMLFGESFALLEIHDGHGFGQAGRDGYVGYVPESCLAPAGAEATHRVGVLASHRYPAPDIRAPDPTLLPFGAEVAVTGEAGAFRRLACGGFVPRAHLVPIDWREPDPVTTAESFLGVPYLWGGDSLLGIDCSGLVQAALRAAGRTCPRDSDQQAAIGHALASGSPLQRGDLVFWRGHVGIMRDGETLLHANAHHMSVVSEPLAEACVRIAAAGFGAVTGCRRL